MTRNEKNLVLRSFAQVMPIAETTAELFYGRLFELDPTLRPMFRGDMREQGRKLMQMLAVAVHGLDRLHEILPAVRAMGRRHAVYGVTDEHYDTVASALLWTLEQGLGEQSLRLHQAVAGRGIEPTRGLLRVAGQSRSPARFVQRP